MGSKLKYFFFVCLFLLRPMVPLGVHGGGLVARPVPRGKQVFMVEPSCMEGLGSTLSPLWHASVYGGAILHGGTPGPLWRRQVIMEAPSSKAGPGGTPSPLWRRQVIMMAPSCMAGPDGTPRPLWCRHVFILSQSCTGSCCPWRSSLILESRARLTGGPLDRMLVILGHSA